MPEREAIVRLTMRTEQSVSRARGLTNAIDRIGQSLDRLADANSDVLSRNDEILRNWEEQNREVQRLEGRTRSIKDIVEETDRKFQFLKEQGFDFDADLESGRFNQAFDDAIDAKKELDRALEETRSVDLDETTAATDNATQSMDRATEAVSRNRTEVKRAARETEAASTAVERPSSRLERAFSLVRERVGQIPARLRQAVPSMQRLRRLGSGVQAAFAKVLASVRTIATVVGGSLAIALGAIGVALAGIGLGVAASVKGIRAAIRRWDELTDAVRRYRAITRETGGSTGETTAEIVATARQLGVSTDDVLRGLEDVRREAERKTNTRSLDGVSLALQNVTSRAGTANEALASVDLSSASIETRYQNVRDTLSVIVGILTRPLRNALVERLEEQLDRLLSFLATGENVDRLVNIYSGTLRIVTGILSSGLKIVSGLVGAQVKVIDVAQGLLDSGRARFSGNQFLSKASIALKKFELKVFETADNLRSKLPDGLATFLFGANDRSQEQIERLNQEIASLENKATAPLEDATGRVDTLLGDVSSMLSFVDEQLESLESFLDRLPTLATVGLSDELRVLIRKLLEERTALSRTLAQNDQPIEDGAEKLLEDLQRRIKSAADQMAARISRSILSGKSAIRELGDFFKDYVIQKVITEGLSRALQGVFAALANAGAGGGLLGFLASAFGVGPRAERLQSRATEAPPIIINSYFTDALPTSQARFIAADPAARRIVFRGIVRPEAALYGAR